MVDIDVCRYRPQIEAALSYAGGTHRYEDVASMVAAGQLLLWPGPASVIVTELIDFPRRRVLNLFLAGGTLRELRAMLPFVLEWGKDHGCHAASLTGRRGWARSFLRDQGWATSDLVTMSKVL